MVNGITRGVARGAFTGQRIVAERESRAQEIQLAQRQVAEEKAKRQAAEKVVAAPTSITIGGKTFSRFTINKALNNIKKLAEGRRAPEIDASVTAATTIILRTRPDLAAAVEEGAILKQQARKGGFGSVKEFTAVRGQLRKDIRVLQKELFVPGAQIGTATVSPTFLRGLQKRASEGDVEARKQLKRVGATVEFGEPLKIPTLKERFAERPFKTGLEEFGKLPERLEKKLTARQKRKFAEFEATATPQEVARARAALEKFTDTGLPKSQEVAIFGTRESQAEVLRGVTASLPFFIPVVGPILLAGSAIEQVATVSGREELSQIKASLQDKGLSAKQATVLTALIPITELGLGFVGLRAAGKATIKSIAGVSKTKVTGATREKIRTAIIQSEPDLAKAIQSKKLTANRVYTTTVGDEKVILVEFSKLSKQEAKIISKEIGISTKETKDLIGRRFVTGVQLDKKGKISRTFSGFSIERSGPQRSKLITKLVSRDRKGKATQLEFFEEVTGIGGSKKFGTTISISKGKALFKGATKVSKQPLFNKVDVRRLSGSFAKEKISAEAIEESIAVTATKPFKVTAKITKKPFGIQQTKEIKRIETGLAVSVSKPIKPIKLKSTSLLKPSKPLKPIQFGISKKIVEAAVTKAKIRKAFAPTKIKTAPGKTLGGTQRLVTKPVKVTKLKTTPELIRPSGVSGLLARQRKIGAGRLRFSPSIATAGTVSTLLRSKQQSKLSNADKVINRLRDRIVQVQGSKITTTQKIELRQKLNQQLRTSLISRIRITALPKPRTARRIILIPPLFGGKKPVKFKKGPLAPKDVPGFNVLAKPKGKKKFMRINKVPITKAKALNLGGFITDHSLGATFKISKTNKVAQKPKLRVPTRYFSRNDPKFRTFKKRKGKKIQLSSTFIEKRRHRLDTASEVKKITVAKKLKELERLSFFKKKKGGKKK